MSKTWNGKNRRNHWRRLKLKYRMPILIGVPTLLLMIFASVFSFKMAQTALNQQSHLAFAQLLSDKSGRLRNWFDTVHTDIHILSELGSTRSAIQAFSAGWQDFGADQEQTLQRLYISENPFPTGEKDKLEAATDGSTWSAAHALFHSDFHSFQQRRHYYDIFLFDPEGNLIYSVFKESDFATNLQNGAFADSGLGEVFRGAINLPEGDIYTTEFAPYEPSFGAAAKFIASPVYDETGTSIGVVALQLPVDEISSIISDSELLGATGQIYAVGADGKARSDSLKENGHALLDDLPDLPQIRAATSRLETEFDNVTGLSGEPVIAFTHAFDFYGTNWQLVLEQDVAEANLATNRLLSIAVLQALVVMAIVVVIAFWVARTLTSRISSLSNSVSEMAKGDTETAVAQIKTGDELGDIARAIERFRQQLSDGKTAIANQDIAAKAQSEVMEKLNSALARLSDGALDCTLDTPFPDSYEELRQNFNRSVKELAAIIDQIKPAARIIDNDANTMSEGADQLSQRTENQAATLEQTAAAMELLSQSVGETAQGAQEIVRFIDSVQAQAEHGEKVGKETHSAMTDIETSAHEIEQIVQLIDDIAFQTNLLALNAGVEAARAGDAGRGFSVVASEVRALSLRSSENASQIRALITKSGDSVKRGVELANDMGDAIKSILGGVSQVSDNIRTIATSAEEQAMGLLEMNTGITALDNATQQNASVAENTAISSRQLQQKAEEMNNLVSRFHGAPGDLSPSHAAPSARVA